MRNYKSSSTVKPLEWDLTSSKKKVYHNYNIIQEFPEEGSMMYFYDVIYTFLTTLQVFRK